MGDYDNVIIVAPLWWNNMAAPLQTFLFKYGAEMNGKHIGLIVSSGESSIERGHRDRYIGSLFRVDVPVPVILRPLISQMTDSLLYSKVYIVELTLYYRYLSLYSCT